MMSLNKTLIAFTLVLVLAMHYECTQAALPFSSSLVRQDDNEPDDEAMMPSASPSMGGDNDMDDDDDDEGMHMATKEPEMPGSGNGMPDQGSGSEMDTEMDMMSPTEEAMPSASAEADDEICVDMTYLSSRGIDSMHLVHRQPFAARVFCPRNGLPCATAHHMVRVQGTSLSYSKYCNVVECDIKENVLVNSVFSHLWEEVEGEHVKDTTLTMFDARHPEGAQKILHRVMAAARRVM